MDLIEYGEEKVPATYLGDAVYVIYDGYHYILRVNDHRNEEGQIFLESAVLTSFDNFREDCQVWREKEIAKRKEGKPEKTSNLA